MSSKVLIDCSASLFPNNGVGRVTTQLINALLTLPEGLSFTLYSRSYKRRYFFPRACKHIHLPLPKLFEGGIRKLGLIDLLSGKADLFHATDHFMPVKDQSRAIVTIHDLIFLKKPEKRLKVHEEMARTVPELLQNCRHIITCSEYSKKDIIETLNTPADKISVIPWGINRDIFSYSHDTSINQQHIKRRFNLQSPYFMAVSCSGGRKNTYYLLDCYRKLLNSNPMNDLVLVWDAPEDVRSYYRHPKIHFIGKVSDSELQSLYSCATASVYPSLYEGFGLPVLESMACGTPVICSGITSLPEVGGDACMYIDPHDSKTLLSAMEKIENNEVDLNLLRDKGLKQALNFNWEECARKTLAVYKRCM